MFNLFKKPLKPLNLQNYDRTRRVSQENIGKPQIEFTYRDNKTGNQVAYVRFVPNTGQIGIIDVNKQFQRRTLGRQIVDDIEKELTGNKNQKMWVACSENHFYWSKFPGFQFENSIHSSVNSCGYSKKIA
jgi:hypothetical protein